MGRWSRFQPTHLRTRQFSLLSSAALSRFKEVTDPRTLFTTEAAVAKYKILLSQYEKQQAARGQGRTPRNEKELWEARQVLEVRKSCNLDTKFFSETPAAAACVLPRSLLQKRALQSGARSLPHVGGFPLPHHSRITSRVHVISLTLTLTLQ